jgi:hypothetical protein
MTDPAKYTEEEKLVLKKLLEAVNAFHDLPEMHPNHPREFNDAVHVAQRIVMSRIARRCEPEVHPPF